jgi:hypothetical protein
MTTPITDTIRKAEEEFEKLNLVEFLDYGINGKVAGQIPVFQKMAVKNHIKSTNLALLKAVEEAIEKVLNELKNISHHPDQAWYDGIRSSKSTALSIFHQAREELGNPQS